jgi:hypothetical protein
MAQDRRDHAWEDRMVASVSDGVTRAAADLAPVRLSAGRGNVQIGYNRRFSSLWGTDMTPNPAGPVAPWVDVLRVDGPDDRTRALLFSHAAHSVAVHTADTRFSADFPGFAARTVRQRLGENVLALFAQGCCADINVEPLSMGYAEAERAGTMLGEAAAEAAARAVSLSPGPFRTVVKEALLPFEPLSADVLRAVALRADEALQTLSAAGKSGSELYNYHELPLWVRRMTELKSRPDGWKGLPVQVTGFALGPDLAVIGLPHEMFVEYQLALQRESPFPRTMVFGYTNACADYVPTAEAFVLGGYEVMGAPKGYGWPSLTPDCERIVKETGRAVLGALWDQRPGKQ